MSLAPNPQNYMLGRGRIYFDAFDANGNKTGLLDLGNAPAFNVSISTEKLDHYSSRSGLRVKDKSILLEVGVTVTFTLDEINVENLKLAFLGSKAAYTQTSGSVVDTPITAISDRYVDLPHRKISNVVVTDAAGTTTYVNGTDYVLDTSAGLIMALSSGSIADGANILIDYSYDAIDSEEIKAVTNPNTSGYLKFVGDPAAGITYEAEFWYVNLSVNGDIGFITESDWAQIEFTADIVKQEITHPDSPYFSVYKLG